MKLENLPILYVDNGHSTLCWVWQGRMNKKTGYGVVSGDGVYQTAHRWVYKLTKGSVPERWHVDHLCRVRACVNPDHLEAVTQRTNTQRGDATKLIFDDIKVIRGAFAEGMTNTELSLLFGVERSYMSRITTGKVRTHE